MIDGSKVYTIKPVTAPRQVESDKWNPRRTDEEILAAYAETKNVWKAGKALGISGQTVHDRLVKLGANTPIRVLTDAEKAIIEAVYRSGIKRADGKLQALSKQINRTIPFISRYARKAGLTTYCRQMTEEHAHKQSAIAKKWIAENGHPRGALGHKHSPETRKKLSAKSRKYWAYATEDQIAAQFDKMIKTKTERGNLIPPRHKASWKSGWYEVGGKKIYLRSSWEFEYAKILERWKTFKIITEWEYEPETFWFENIKRGVRSYTPDFRVTWPDNKIEYHEIKGWMDARSKTKIKRMAKYHPHIKLVVIESKQYKAILKQFKGL